jgi:hypothetical protein
LFGKPQDVSFESPKGRLRENHCVAINRLEIVHTDAGSMAGPVRARLQREHVPPIARASREVPFESIEDPRRELDSEIARRRCYLDVEEAALTIVRMLRKHDGIGTAVFSQ